MLHGVGGVQEEAMRLLSPRKLDPRNPRAPKKGGRAGGLWTGRSVGTLGGRSRL